jgi:hypothetical protein
MRQQRTSIATVLLYCLAMLFTVPVAAQTFRSGEVSGYFNLEMTYGLRFRLEDRDSSIIGVSNGGGFNINADDGNLNYDRGIVANMVMLKPQLALNWKNVGFFARGYGFYDFENSNGKRGHADLSDDAKEDVARHADLQEAYLSVAFMVGQMPTRLRLGKQIINWGEAIFFQGAKAMNPVNAPLVTRPGATPSDLFKGQNMLWGLIAVTPMISLEGFYQLGWEPSELLSTGTYLSSYDPGEGSQTYNGRNNFIPNTSNDRQATDIFNALGLNYPQGTCEAMNGGAGPQTFSCQTDAYLGMPVLTPDEPDSNTRGDWGFTVRSIIPQLNDTKLAFHFARFRSHFPISRLKLADFPGLAELGFTDPQFGTAMPTPYTQQGVGLIAEELAANGICDGADCRSAAANLALHWPVRTVVNDLYYPEDKVNLFGISFSSTARTGTALAGEVVYQQNVPLQVHPSQILWAATNPTVSSAQCNDGNTVSLGDTTLPCAPLEYRDAYEDDLVIYRDTYQTTFSAVQLLPRMLGADTWSLGVEASWLHIADLPGKPANSSFCNARPDQRAPRDEVTLLSVPGTQFAECDASAYAYVDEDAWGYRVFAGARWTGVFGALSVAPRLIFKDDVDGHAPLGQMIEGRKELKLGLTTSFLRSASVDVSYATFWGAGVNNLINDRDYLDVVFKYEF